LFQYFNQLSLDQQQQMLGQLSQIDPQRVNGIFRNAMDEAAKREAGGTI
jgi:hypothetical protein